MFESSEYMSLTFMKYSLGINKLILYRNLTVFFILNAKKYSYKPLPEKHSR